MHNAVQKERESGKVVRSVVVRMDQMTSLKEFGSRLDEAIEFASSPKIRNFDETMVEMNP